MKCLVLAVAALVVASPALAQAGQRVGTALPVQGVGNSTSSGVGVTRQDSRSQPYNPNSVPGQRIGNFEAYSNGMVLPRLESYHFYWNARPCQSVSGTTFCQ
jgi:hypothetical protein